jgi:hypothetical protein
MLIFRMGGRTQRAARPAVIIARLVSQGLEQLATGQMLTRRAHDRSDRRGSELETDAVDQMEAARYFT